MGLSFELSTPQEKEGLGTGYTITVGTQNDYTDGTIRIEPPVYMDLNDFNHGIATEGNLIFESLIVGRHATTMDFTPDFKAQRESNMTKSPERRIRDIAEVLVSNLALIESKDAFTKGFHSK